MELVPCQAAANVWLSEIKVDQKPGFVPPQPEDWCDLAHAWICARSLGPKKAVLFLLSSYETLGLPGKKKVTRESKCPVRALGGGGHHCLAEVGC